MHIDDAQNAWGKLAPEIESMLSTIETEQDTRLHIIDRILIEVLGWPRESIRTERHSDAGYTDYLLVHGERNLLVLEAKRSQKILLDTKNPKIATYKLGGAALKSAQPGINQARVYCLETGVPIATLTSGLEWIAFWALRTDGKAPNEGQAIVFPNLAAITDNFSTFYDLFSRDGVSQEISRIRLNEAEGLRVQHGETLVSINDPNKIRLLARSDIASDLDRIFREFFSVMSGDTDPEMLAKCFVNSKESHEADSALQKITHDLINQVEVVSASKGEELARHIEDAAETKRGEFVLIIGNKGAGKSTFIERFFQLVLDKQLRDRCLLARIDLLNSTGERTSITSWLIESLKDQVENELFNGASPSYEELQGVFWKEYQRWRNGEHKVLYEQDRTAFKIKFGEYIANLIDNKPELYVKKLLLNAVRSRHLLPCIVFDNTDHFPQPFQEDVFQFAQSIFRSGLSFIICPITDRTIWRLSKQGPLQSYVTTPFYLPVPSTKDVLSKRIEFIKEKLGGEGQTQNQYFIGKGIRLSIQNIRGFAAAIEDIFINTEYMGRVVGWLSNHDIRRGLYIAQRIITSPIITIENLVSVYVTGKREIVDVRKTKRALFWGNYNGFQPSDSDFIVNLFSIHPSFPTSPLGKPSILRLLIDKDNQARQPTDSYFSIGDIVNYLEPVGISRSAIFEFCKELLAYRLIEPYDPTDDDVYAEQRVRVTHSGKIHLEFALEDETYVIEMAKATPIRDINLVTQMRAKLFKGKNTWEDWITFISTFMTYCLSEDNVFVTIPNTTGYEGQKELRDRMRTKWIR